ncbi:MAG: SAM-dependent methyltransferase [Anaerolineae bacterium]|jgi:16S rRNA (cytidine1402-2'-O)-methyltransferase
MGTLYVVGTPAGARKDLTLRARRTLAEADLIAAADLESARDLLARLGITAMPAGVQELPRLLEALAGGDVALLQDGRQIGAGPGEYGAIRAALDNGHQVVPIPGPSLAMTALVISGLPADTFVYLGELPHLPARRQALLASLSTETRTLVALVARPGLPGLLAEMEASLGDRRCVLVGATEGGTGAVWRGELAAGPGQPAPETGEDLQVLVVEGASDEPLLWDEARLRAAVRDGLGRGLGAKGVSRALAADSGWPRRDIYDLAVALSKQKPPEA